MTDNQTPHDWVLIEAAKSLTEAERRFVLEKRHAFADIKQSLIEKGLVELCDLGWRYTPKLYAVRAILKENDRAE